MDQSLEWKATALGLCLSYVTLGMLLNYMCQIFYILVKIKLTNISKIPKTVLVTY